MKGPGSVVCHTVIAIGTAALIVGCGNSDPAGSLSGPGGSAGQFADPVRAQCVLDSPRLQVGAGLDAPGRLEVDTPAIGNASGACAGNQQFRFGSGLHDITGVVAYTGGMGWESPTQVFAGLHMRQYARAFAIESPCNGKRVMFVDSDTGMIFGAVRLHVLDAIAADPELNPFYGPDNVMLSATHTHQGPAGYSHYEAFNTFHFGFDEVTFLAIANGIFEAIKLAHANIQAHEDPAAISLAIGELLNTNINRSLPAFDLNTEAERRAFLNARGEQIETDKRVVQLNFVRDNGSPVGIINWFGVHPTIIGSDLSLVSSDMKGYAGLNFERIMQSRYDAAPGPDNFVAAFSQADEGDSSPNIFIREKPFPDPARGGGVDAYDSSVISGTKHLAKGLELYRAGAPLSGPVDYRLFHVQMDSVQVTDPVVLESLSDLPPELDVPDEEKRTCLAALGVSFGAGAEDGPGPTVEGVDCADSPDVIAAAQADIMAALGAHIPPHLAATTVLCNLDQLPALDLSCHAEKAILFVVGPPLSAEPNIIPMQIFRLGNLALVGIPWEVGTIPARRIRKTLLDLLAPAGVDTVVVAGLVNEYSHYLTTREEYSSQQYEGASNIYGPWTLPAVQQELRRLATTLRDGTPAPAGPAYLDTTPRLVRPPYIPSDLPGLGTSFGDLITDVPVTAAPGDIVRAEFQAGHPRNDLKIQSSYVYAERQNAGGSWTAVVTDKDEELLFVWKPLLPSPLPIDPPVIGSSTAEAVWHIPKNTPPGTYRLRHEGAAQTTPLMAVQAYEGISSPFTIAGAVEACP